MVVRVLGITGTFQSGKDTVSALLGWKKYSCSDIIREECLRRGLSIDINQNLINIGDDLRKSSGDAGILAKKALERISKDNVSRVVVVSIRTPAEVLALKNAENVDFRLLVLDAPIEVRFQRARTTERFVNMSFDEFKSQEDKQLKGGDVHNMHLEKVFEMSDARIFNEFSSLEELRVVVNDVLNGFGWL
ncbi:hypothetical protein HY484_04210 [Candidatus Woesearchaeota archaeon]|nr:hypothetical protein [Candidatus Woesearchaeota archaeon]